MDRVSTPREILPRTSEYGGGSPAAVIYGPGAALSTPFDFYSSEAPLSMSCVACHVGEGRVAMPSGCRSRPLLRLLFYMIVQCNDVHNAMPVVGSKDIIACPAAMAATTRCSM